MGDIRVLVTGANGFVGRNILRAFEAFPEVKVVAACRSPEKLPRGFIGAVRAGDLTDKQYCAEIVKDIDVVCHAGTWASLWNHREREREQFYQPSIELIEQAIAAGVKRFIFTSTNVVTAPGAIGGPPIDHAAAPRYRRFWPHLNFLIDVEKFMQHNSGRGTQMVSLRLAVFVGAGNELGLVPALLPRMRTRLVPWLRGGRSRMGLIADTDIGQSFAKAALASDLNDFESFNICGSEFPTTREVIEFISKETGFPAPYYSVPFAAGYAFGFLMEKLNTLLPASSPFLTRSIIHLSEDWFCDTSQAAKKLGFVPQKDWKAAVREALAECREKGYAWRPLYH